MRMDITICAAGAIPCAAPLPGGVFLPESLQPYKNVSYAPEM